MSQLVRLRGKHTCQTAHCAMVRFAIKLEKIRNHKRCRLAESSSGDFQTESKHWLVLEFENSVSPFKARKKYVFENSVRKCLPRCFSLEPEAKTWRQFVFSRERAPLLKENIGFQIIIRASKRRIDHQPDRKGSSGRK